MLLIIDIVFKIFWSREYKEEKNEIKALRLIYMQPFIISKENKAYRSKIDGGHSLLTDFDIIPYRFLIECWTFKMKKEKVSQSFKSLNEIGINQILNKIYNRERKKVHLHFFT